MVLQLMIVSSSQEFDKRPVEPMREKIVSNKNHWATVEIFPTGRENLEQMKRSGV